MAKPTADLREALLLRLAPGQGRRDTAPDIEVGQDIAKRKDAASVEALVGLLTDRRAGSSALKALYECGYLAPELLAPHAETFLALLDHKNNRFVWGGAIALSCIAKVAPGAVWAGREKLQKLFPGGSVITRDAVVRALSLVAASTAARERALAPWLLQALVDVRPVNLPRWAEDILPVLSGTYRLQARATVEDRLGELSASAQQRVKRLLRS